MFRTTFRLLAAKVLLDRGHEVAKSWDADNIDSVLEGISAYYRLPRLATERSRLKRSVFEPAWRQLRLGINFRNISARSGVRLRKHADHAGKPNEDCTAEEIGRSPDFMLAMKVGYHGGTLAQLGTRWARSFTAGIAAQSGRKATSVEFVRRSADCGDPRIH